MDQQGEEVLLIDCCPSSYLFLSCKLVFLSKFSAFHCPVLITVRIYVCSIFCIVSIKYFMILQEEILFILVCSWYILGYFGIVLLIDCCPSFYLVFSSKYGLLVKIHCISLHCIDNCKNICNIFCIVSIKYFIILQEEITFLHGVGVKNWFLETKNPVCRNWFLQLELSKIKYGSKRGRSHSTWLLPFIITSIEL